MEEHIGKYIRRKLRLNRISNKVAGDSVGLSESAFEKLLLKDDILLSRLLNLSKLVNHNFLDFFYDSEPLLGFREAELSKFISKLSESNRIIEKNEIIIELQSKYIAELEAKLTD